MITYEEYAEIRDKKNLTDGKIAEKAGFGRSTFSDWKSGRSVPKAEKMQKIAEVLEMDYSEFIGPIGKFSSHRTDIKQETPEKQKNNDLLNLFENADPAVQDAVMTLLKSARHDS